MPRKKTYWLLIMAGFIAAGALGVLLKERLLKAPDILPNPEKLSVVTTFFPLYDFTKKIAEDKINLDILFSQTPEVVSFSPQDLKKINTAEMVIKNGIGLEPVLDELIASSDNTDITVIDTSVGAATLSPDHGIKFEEGVEEEGRGNIDPHIWLDPNNAIIQVKNIRDALMSRDPTNADFYRENAENYTQELRALDQEINETIGKLSKKYSIAFHSAFQYFAKRYGLNQTAVIEEFPGKEPSLRYLFEVIKLIRKLGITVIFSEPQFSPKIIDVIARDLNLKVYQLNPIETGDPAKDSYISIMRKNLETLREALR